ncbi:hypothetical protein AB4Y36_03615 [Paraburkholderia sp. BR10936]|uniref:hypothetical protein n=1 Tax=Paraburkholderia sp. BR10936 TaxID=3236993 RepID=UPI0034D318B4
MAKELSMTASAFQKREKRAKNKIVAVVVDAPEASQNAPETLAVVVRDAVVELTPAQPKILRVGHAFIKGKGKNDKPKKDSIWGIMQHGDVLIKFFGRRNGAIRFQQEPIALLEGALKLYEHKLAGTDAKKLKHEDLDEAAQKQLLGEDWPQPLFEKYKASLEAGKVDVRSDVRAEQTKGEEVREQPAWPWPTAAMFENV